MKTLKTLTTIITLTAGLALATLPALGDLNYLKEGYKYIEKIPIKVSSSINNKDRDTQKLVDNNKNTEWISWKENVIWEEDYSQERYFTGTVIDGANATASTISNNTLSLAAIPVSTDENPTSRKWRQYQLFNTGNDSYPNEMSNLKAGPYTLKIKYRGTVAAEKGLRLYFGNGSGSVGDTHDIDVSTEWTDEEITFNLPGDVVTGAVCCVQPGHYPGIIEVESAELSGTSIAKNVYTKDYSKYEPDYTFTGSTLENGILVAKAAGSDWFQFDAAPATLELKPNTHYKVTLNLRGAETPTTDNVSVWIGSRDYVNGAPIGYVDNGVTNPDNASVISMPAYSTKFGDISFEFTTNDKVVDFATSPAAIRLQPARQKISHDIEIKSIKIEGSDGSSVTYDYLNEMKWPFKAVTNGNQDYIPSLVTEGGKTVVKVTNPRTGNYSFRLDYDFTIPEAYYTFKAKIKAETTGKVHMMIGSAGGVKENFVLELNPSKEEYTYETINSFGGSGYWIVCEPIGTYQNQTGDYEGNFTIESLELTAKNSQTITPWTITNTGDYAGGGDTDYREVKDGVIYSYPLPERRKVILAVGDGAHTSQQYENKAGFTIENNHIYSVVYKIKGSDGSNPVKFVLANSNGWTVVGESSENTLPTDGYAEIRNNISTTQAVTNGAVVLDLGYNVGSVDIEGIRVIDNYDERIGGVHNSSNVLLSSQEKNITSGDNFIYTQFFVFENLNLDTKNNDYKVKVRLRASEPGKLCIKLGDFQYDGNRIVRWKNFNGAPNDWIDLEYDFTDRTQDITSGYLTLQVQKQNGTEEQDGLNEYSGTVEFDMVKLYHDDGVSEVDVANWNFQGADKFPYNVMGYEPQIENGNLVTQSDASWYQFYVNNSIPLKKGHSYRLYATLKGDVEKNNGITVQFGGWNPNMLIKTMDIPNILTEKHVDFSYAPLDNNFVIFQLFGHYTGKVEYENFRITTNPSEEIDRFVRFRESNVQLSSPYGEYKNFEIKDGLLVVKPQGKPTNIITGLNFDLNKVYKADFDLKVSHPGKYLVTLGDDDDSQSKEIEITQAQIGYFIHQELDFNSVAAENGNLTITPLVYTQSLEVANGKVSYSTPKYDGNSQTGTDYFEVELDGPYTMDSEGKYVFHIGYVQNGTNLEYGTPKEFVILGSSTKNGTFKRLGTYEVGEYNDGNAFISTVGTPLKIAEGENIKFLRFMCTANEDSSTAICFPKKSDGKDDFDNAYIGSMMRMTRFGMYKQSEMFATDNAAKNGRWDDYEHWALPAITRFQIEALGQKYAYPGATLNEMIGVGKSIEICGQLFDNDPYNWNFRRNMITYWDTTLPFLKDTSLGTDKYQYIDYNTFTYPSDDDGNTNYDCIDLLLPKFEDLGAVKKLNGKIDANGVYQVVVSFKRSTGSVEETDNRMVYHVTRTDKVEDKDENGATKLDENGNKIMKDVVVTVSDETSAFKNRGNGFPLEISYQGLILDTDHNKTLVPVDLTERVLTFQNVAEGDSIQFALKILPGWNGVRIFCRENTGNIERRAGGTKWTKEAGGTWSARTVYVQNNAPGEAERGTRIMRLGEIRAYVELDKINIETEAGRKRYDLLYNFRENFNTRGWEHNQGIIADINNLNTVNGSTGDKYMSKGSEGQTWKDVIDTYKDFFDEQGLSYPDFSMIDNPFNDEDVVPSNGRKRKKADYNGQQRQRTYTILHEVLALPGERVDLYPQSDIWQSGGFNYEEQFVRWYDYLTDKAPDYLYFFAEPKSVIKTQDAGFIGGKTLLDHGLRGKGTVASIFYDENERKAFEERLKDDPDAEDERYYYDNVYGTVRIMDNWVAADFSLSFNTNLAERLGKNTTTWENEGTTIQEPIINFRHLFHITSGSLFADKYMRTAEGNRHYAKSNRRYISSFAGKTFKIRLEQAMPVNENTKSAFYYRTGDEYKRVRGYDIRTYKLGDKKSDEVGDAITLSGSSLQGESDVVEDMFGIDNSSKFNHVDSYVQTTTQSSKWLRNSLEFARAIACDADKANAGRYLVRLYGKDENSHIIGLPESVKDGEPQSYKPLVIAEYEVEFMGNEYASFLPEKIIDILDKEGGDLAHHTEKYLERHYGATSDVKAVNFDKYTILNSESVIVDKGSAPVNFRRYGFFENATGKSFKFSESGKEDYVNYTLNSEISRMKMPIRWSDSNYGFGYMTTGDYNMFRLADHSLMTPYMDAASSRHGEEVTGVDKNGNEVTTTGVNGTYDRLFYNTGGTEKGLFYYVNAAADPGEMVKIDFDYLCPGSTIYVSAWVNEFNNGQPETANVIFNFYANVAKGEGAEKTIIRQEQIHGFATGYVERGKYDEDQALRYRDGDQGKWMHVYYSFVPDDSHADVVKAEGEYIDSYYLVLENNSISSEGADYAIDDIRAYVIAPRVEARQSNSLCERNDVDINIEVELPLEALVQSLTGQQNEDGIVSLQYSIVDKVIYDDVLENIKTQKENDYLKAHPDDTTYKYEFSTDDYYSAFADGVLHYKHDNIKTSDASGKVEKPLSWGVIDFYMDYDDSKYKDENGKYNKGTLITNKNGEVLTINGKTWTIGDYMDKYFKDVYEKCFVFTTKPVSENEDGKENYNEIIKTHRDYYIVVDNIGTDHVFSSLFYDIDDEGNIKKDDDGNDVFLPGFDATYLTKYNSDVYPDKKENQNYPLDEWNSYDKELAKAYKIGSNCARMAAFSLKGSAQIVIDGVLHENDDNITCCENQRPVVQINLKTKDKDDNLAVKDEAPESENPYLDWWTGPFEDFAEETSDITENGQILTLWDILDNFRTAHPYAETWDMPTREEQPKVVTIEEGEIANPYTNSMRDYLKGLCATKKVNEQGETVPVEPKLILHQSSFVFPQSATKLVDKNGKKVSSKEIFVTAIPPKTPTVIKDKDEDGNVIASYVICTQPREVKITVSNTSPTLFNGFNEIKYPDEIEDVPLRIGLMQLEKFAEGGTNRLYVPLRNVKKATYDVTEFLPFGEDNKKTTCEIYLVETNDPNYRKLSDNAKLDEDDPSDTYNVKTRVVGKVTQLDVKFKTKTVESEDTSENEGTPEIEVTSEVEGTPMAQVVFDEEEKAVITPGVTNPGEMLDKGITFREGYYYKFKFNFMEGETKLSEQEGYEMPCNGQTVFSIKVVPEYQIWTGDSSLNYNNDDNWRRVTKEQLLASSDVPYGKGTDSRYTVNSTYSTTHSYAPLNFTKVIIPAGTKYPQLAARRHSFGSEGALEGADSKLIDNGKKSESYIWTGNSPKAVKAAGTDKESSIWNASAASSYDPTVYINYDMAAVTYENADNADDNVYCRPWYANACEQIHFNSNAEILNQQNLDYQKAWVDMEMSPYRWYNVASPLYGVVAGDMYLPTDDTDKINKEPGRQMTELFKPIEFDSDINDRFAPAVYQRGWDKGNETVYTVHGESTAEKETVALASTWSHVYNDVTEEYAPGMGVSVKTDVTRLPKFADDYEGDDKQTLVKFRFPKADAKYNYFDDKITAPGEENHRDLTRTKAGKLYGFEAPEGKQSGDVVLKKANDGNLFLVGNPFMAHLNMAEFLKVNTDIESKYWILSEGEGQVGVVMAHEKETTMLSNETLKSGTVTANSATNGLLPPMQGFFVQAKNPGTQLTIKFTPDMMAVEPYTDATGAPILKAPRPETRADGEDIIRVSTPESTAIIRLTAAAEKGYAASEDVEMIDDSNQRGIRRVYTVAGTMAAAINQTPDADGVEVGLMAPTDSVTVVTFNGLALEDYMLYDTATGEKTQLYDGFELEMEGSVSGRYFLTAGIDTAEIEDAAIRIIPGKGEVVVKAPAVCGALTVRVFDTLGREVAAAEGFEEESRIALEPGIYVVEAEGSEAGRKSAKVSIR